MRRTNSLKNYLEFLTTVYHPDGKRIPIEWTKGTPHADIRGQYIAINPNVRDWIGKNLTKPQELRVIVDTLSHEVEHFVESDLQGKKRFMEQYPEAPKTAGSIYNILEDHYIDFTRTNRWKGLRVSRAFTVDSILSNHHRHKRVDKLEDHEAMLEGYLQIALSGYAKGINDLEDGDVKKFLGWSRQKIRNARSTDSPDEREEIAHEITNKYLNLVGIDDAEDFADEIEIPTGNQFESDELDFDEDSAFEPEEAEADNERSELDENEQSGASSDGDADEEESDEFESGSGDGENDSDSESDDSDDESKQGSESGENEQDEGDTGEGAGDSEDGESITGLDPEDYDTIEDEIGNDETVQTALPGIGSEGDDPSSEDAKQPTALGAESDDTDESIAEGNAVSPERDRVNPSGDAGDAKLEGEIESMEAMDDDRQSGEWYGVSSDSDYEEPSARFEEKVHELKQKTKRSNTSLGEKKSKRDEHVENFQSDYKSVVNKLEDTGLAHDIEEAFRELKTRDRQEPREQGEEIHLQNAIEYRAGDYSKRRVYKHRLPAEVGDRAVSVAVDLSGSMPEHDAKVALLGLQKACNIIGDEFTACGFKTFNNSGHTVIYTPLITGPQEEFKPEHLSAVFSGGTTPMASGIQQARELLSECTRPERVLIVITDGKPNVRLDGSGSRRGQGLVNEECHELVNDARTEGVKVIGLGFGGVDEHTMKQIFGNNGYAMGNVSNLAEKLIGIYRGQMSVDDGQ